LIQHALEREAAQKLVGHDRLLAAGHRRGL
jgi:hypothetical protein